MNQANSSEYCNLRDFALEMRSVHGYLSLIVCIFGSIANILNICVLTTREMRIPTNFILTGLAVSDLLVMLEYFPFTSHTNLNTVARKQADYFSYPWAVYMYFHALFTQVCHFNSCCLTVMLAGWRYIALNKPQMNKIWCNPYRTKLAICTSCVLCPFVCTPLFVAVYIRVVEKRAFANGTIIDDKQLPTLPNGTKHEARKLYVLAFDRDYAKINFVIYSVVLKLIPCVLLTVLSVLLIRSLWDAKERWRNLSNNSGVPLVKTMDQQRRDLEKEQQADRTTRMLLVVLLLFLIPEIPQATMGLLSAVVPGDSFRANCYDSLGDLFDIMALVGSSITFILYCSMSAQFRTAFRKMFKFDALRDFLRRHLRMRRNPETIATINECFSEDVDDDGGGHVESKNGKLSVTENTAASNRELNSVAEKRPISVEANLPDTFGVRV